MHSIFVYFVRGGFRTKIKCTLKIQSKAENPQRSVAVRKFHAYERSGVPRIRKFSAYEIFWIYSIFSPLPSLPNLSFTPPFTLFFLFFVYLNPVSLIHSLLSAFVLLQPLLDLFLTVVLSIEDFSKDGLGTRYGASPARNDRDVCVSRLICHLVFDFGKPTIDHCCVPRFSNGRRTNPSLSYHSFPLSSELSKHSLVALRRDEGANSRRLSESTRSMQWALPPKDFHFPSRAQESVDSPTTDHGKARKASRFLKADAVPSVFFFSSFFANKRRTHKELFGDVNNFSFLFFFSKGKRKK